MASDQSIIDRQSILIQILLAAGLKIVLFTSKHTVTNFMSVHRPSTEKRLPLTGTRPQESTCANSRYRPRLDHLLVTRSRNL